MTPRRWLRWLASVLLFCVWAAAAQTVAPVKVGVLAYRSKAQTQAQWQPLAAALRTAVPGRDFQVQAFTQAELEQAVNGRQVDFVLTNPGHYVLLQRRAGLLAPLATLIADQDGHDLATYSGVIFTRSDNIAIHQLVDLRGRRVAAVSTSALGGYQMQLLELKQAGLDPTRDIRLLETGLPQDQVVDVVLAGRVDAGFVRSGLLEDMAREGRLDLAQVRVINAQNFADFPVRVSTALYPQWPVAYLAHVDEHLAREVAAALFLMHDNQALMRAIGIRGFSVPADYTPVAELLRELRMPPFEAVPAFTWRDVWQRYQQPLLAGLFLLVLMLVQSVRVWLARRSLAAEVQSRRASEQAAVQSREILLRVIDNIPIRIFWKDRQSRYLGCNTAFARDTGLASVEQVIGKDDFDLVWKKDADALQQSDRTVMASNQAKLGYDEQQQDAEGTMHWLRTSKVPLRDDQAQVFGVLGLYEDVTEQRRTQAQLRLAASVFEHAREGIFITDANSRIIEVNHAFTVITGYTKGEALGRNPRLFNSGQQDEAFYQAMFEQLAQKGHWQGELWNRRKSGDLYASMLTLTAVRDNNNQLSHYVALFFDITAVKLHQQQLEHIAHYDTLTNLPNRVMLADRLHQAMAQALRRGQLLGVVYLDLDGFKQVNDDFGHDVGDRLLVMVSDQMKRALREGDTLARLGGDEFVAVLTDLNDANDCASTLQRLLDAAGQPMPLGEADLKVSASLGVTFFPQSDPVDADQLLRQADQAMYLAKQQGKNRYHIFDSAQDRSARGLHENLEEISRALDADQFVLYFQPKVHMPTGRVVGAEALIRWQHPTKGLVPPGLFLPLIENHALSVKLDDWVIRHALQQQLAWKQAGVSLQVSVNAGARTLQQADFAQRLQAMLAQFPGLSPSCLQIEVLETSALKDVERAAQVIRDCNALGVSFALDDFGTGYSSLAYLKSLPVKTIKIDQSFVRDMLDDADDLAILQGVIGLAHAFGREVIAEGVETVAQGVRLLQLGCEQGQGYYIARPMPADALPGWVAQWQPDAAWVQAASVKLR